MVAASGRPITYEILNEGTLFGELSALDGLPRSTGVYAEDP
jgi:CRP-like cAMP-binding protein